MTRLANLHIAVNSRFEATLRRALDFAEAHKGHQFAVVRDDSDRKQKLCCITCGGTARMAPAIRQVPFDIIGEEEDGI